MNLRLKFNFLPENSWIYLTEVKSPLFFNPLSKDQSPHLVPKLPVLPLQKIHYYRLLKFQTYIYKENNLIHLKKMIYSCDFYIIIYFFIVDTLTIFHFLKSWDITSNYMKKESHNMTIIITITINECLWIERDFFVFVCT